MCYFLTDTICPDLLCVQQTHFQFCMPQRKETTGSWFCSSWVAQPLRGTDPDRTMASTRTLKDPSIGQHFRRMLICTVLLQMLLQALSVAVTYMYFNNEIKKVSSQVLSATLCFAPQLAPLRNLAED